MKVSLQRKFSTKCISSIKAFKDLPTLPSLPFLGHTHYFLPGGKYETERLTEAVKDIENKLGPIFTLKLGGNNLVITTDADNTETMFRNEGKMPFRPPFPALLHYRKKAFNCIGIVPGNGKEWYRFRGFVLPLLKTNLVQTYLSKHNAVASAFINYIKKNRDDNNAINDIYMHLLRFSIEAISVTCPGRRYECLLDKNNETEEIIQASFNFADGLYETLIGLPTWKLYKNKAYKLLQNSHETIYRILGDNLQNIRQQYLENPSALVDENPFMFSLLNNKTISWDDIVMVSLEIFLGGIDATSSTLALTLHYLAHNQDVQEKARKEAMDGGQNEFKYLKACLKESLRLNATAGANSRFLANSTIIGGFEIPSGTLVSAFSSVSSTNPIYFTNPKSYQPERWFRDSKRNIHAFASLPFGYGSRMCPGRRLAEQEMVVLLKHILSNFKIVSDDNPEIGMVYRMNRIPERPINLTFFDINVR